MDIEDGKVLVQEQQRDCLNGYRGWECLSAGAAEGIAWMDIEDGNALVREQQRGLPEWIERK